MGKFKLNKKHLFYFPTILVLLFSLNLNTFASTSYSVSLADTNFVCSYYNSSEGNVTCTNSTEIVKTDLELFGFSYPSTVIVFPTASIGSEKSFVTDAYLGLYTDTSYNLDFYFCIGTSTSNANCSCSIYLFYYLDGTDSQTALYARENLKCGTWYHVNTNFVTPDITGKFSCALLCSFLSSDTYFSSGAGRFGITDLTFTVDDPLINGTPITTPSTEELENTLNEYEEVMGALPQVDENELADLMEFDFDSFSDGMSFVREMFERTMNTFGFNAVLVFALTVGLATYIIGRKVG